MEKVNNNHEPAQRVEEGESSFEGQMQSPPAFQLQASSDGPPALVSGHSSIPAPLASGPIQRATDYNALAKQVQTELNEYFPDLEDLLPIFSALPPGGGLQKLMNAYNLINPGKALVMHLKEELGEEDYMHVMDAATGVSIAKAPAGSDLMLANTQEAGYNLRADASTSADIIGKLKFAKMAVSVTGKGTADGITWNKIHFKKAVDYALVTKGQKAPATASAMIANQDAWVTADALGTFVPWGVFMSQLAAFDIFTYDKSLKEKITLLRQMAHPEKLPFDDVIGSPSGDFYESDRNNPHALFQLMKDGKAIQTPNGEVIDIYHFIVGLDAYQASRQQAKASPGMGNSDVGRSDAAATWSGDLGAAAADCLLESSSEVEKHLDTKAGKGKSASDSDRLDYYYRSRAPEADLLGDIDAWGAMQDVEGKSPALTMTEIVNNYYGVQRSGKAAFSSKRKDSFKKFMAQYGLTVTKGTVINSANQAILTTQIEKFGVSWIQNRKQAIWPSYDKPKFKKYSVEMADRFLKFIEKHGKANGAF